LSSLVVNQHLMKISTQYGGLGRLNRVSTKLEWF